MLNTQVTSVTPAPVTPKVKERFDINQAKLSGKIGKVWSTTNGSVMVRLALPERNGKPQGATLELLDGQINGQDVSISSEPVSVAGYIKDSEYFQTLRDFLIRAKKADLLKTYPLLDKEGDSIVVQRRMTCIVPLQKQSIAGSGIEALDPNTVRVEGVIWKAWTQNGNTSARIAIYDEHTEVGEGKVGKSGRPYRNAHYLTIRFEKSQVDGIPVVPLKREDPDRVGGLKPGRRIRITGSLCQTVHYETLRGFLANAKRLDLLSQLENSDKLAEITSHVLGTVVIAETMIQYT